MKSATEDYFERVSALAANCHGMEPDQLSELQKVALGIAAGCETEWTGTGYRLKNPIGIQKINGRFVVAEKIG